MGLLLRCGGWFLFVSVDGLAFDDETGTRSCCWLLAVIVGKAELLAVVGDSIQALITVEGLLPPRDGDPDVAIKTVSARLPSEFKLPAL